MRRDAPSLSRNTNEEIAVIIDWNMLSPTHLGAVAQWAGAAMTVLAIGPGPAKDSEASRGP
jgi:hypothetical protein